MPRQGAPRAEDAEAVGASKIFGQGEMGTEVLLEIAKPCLLHVVAIPCAASPFRPAVFSAYGLVDELFHVGFSPVEHDAVSCHSASVNINPSFLGNRMIQYVENSGYALPLTWEYGQQCEVRLVPSE